MPQIKQHFAEHFTLENIGSFIQLVDGQYRPHSPGKYLYKLLLSRTIEEKFTPDGIELLYALLDSWGMNSRNARLVPFSEFSAAVLAQKDAILSLKDSTLADFAPCKDRLWAVFLNLRVMQGRPQLVAVSKLLHFLLPALVAPVDRTYTLRFFYNSTSIPVNLGGQFERFVAVHEEFSAFVQSCDLSGFISTETWNQTLPKLLDTLLIGYMMRQKNAAQHSKV